MARARLLKPGFFSNAALSEVSAHGRLLFAGLWTLADKKGRLRDEPRWIKGQLFPFESVSVDKLLSALCTKGFIQRYESGCEKFIQITNFERHQRPHQNEPESIILGPTSDNVPSPSDIGASTSPGSGSGNTYTDPVAVAVTHNPPLAGGHVLIEGLDGEFYKAYVRQHQETHAGSPPSPNDQAAARKLERDFGADRCLQEARDRNWDFKHPNYLREVFNGDSDGADRGESRKSSNTNGMAADISGLDGREPSLLERRRHRTV